MGLVGRARARRAPLGDRSVVGGGEDAGVEDAERGDGLGVRLEAEELGASARVERVHLAVGAARE